MNNTENDDYWNESKVSTFTFERDDRETADSLFFEDAPDSSLKKESESELFVQLYSDKNIGIETARNYLSERCIHLILQDESDYHETNLSSTIRPDEEIRLLRRQIKERWIPSKVEDTIDRVFYGQPYIFELYKTLSDKKRLLDCAITLADGDTVLAVVMFLARTVKKSIFRQLIMDYPIAISHYIHYLYVRRQMSDLSDILEALGKSKETMIKQLTVACQNPNKLEQRLRLLLKNYSSDSWEGQIVDNYLKLVEWQLIAQKQTNNFNVTGKSPSDFVKYCYSHKLSLDIPNVSQCESQAVYVTEHLKLSNKQSLVVKMQAHCEEKKWDMVRNLLITKGWVGGLRLNTDLPVDKLLDQLRKCDPPNSLIDDILSCVTDVDQKVDIAQKLGRHSVVIEVFNKRKDRPKLLQYMATLDPQSDDWQNAKRFLDTMDPK